MVENYEYKMRLKEILDVFVKICEKYNLTYYLSSGTLLGAVRHKGFIPWDDDIDVDMPIEDYKKFTKIVQKELGSQYFFQDYHTDKCLNVTWGRIRENNTTSMPVQESDFNIHYGIDIDIFPLIGIYSTPIGAKLQRVLYDINVTLLQGDYYKLYKHWKPSIIVRMLYAFPRSVRHLIVDLNNRIVYKKFHGSKQGFSAYSYSSKRNPYFFKNSDELVFEGTKYRVPYNWDGVLKECYGDYMTLPPLDQRGGHEDTLGKIIFDLEKNFEEYRKKNITS